MMERLFQRDLWLKLFSAVIAIVIWAVVMQDYTQEGYRDFEVPLHVVYDPRYEVYEGYQDREMMVTIRVADRNLVISRLRAEDFHAEVNYSAENLGKSVPFEVKVRLLRNDVKVNYTYSPKTVMATLIEVREVQVPIRVEPSTGVISHAGREYRFTVNTPRKTVTVSGRYDYLMTVKQALVSLETIDLLPETKSLQKVVIPVDSQGKPVDKLSSTTAEIELEWEMLPMGRSINVVPTTKGSPPKGYVVTKLASSPPTVLLRASTVNGRLPDMQSLETSPVDLTGQTKSFTATLRLVPPADTVVTPDTVSVAVTIAESTAERTFKGIVVGVVGAPQNMETTLSVTAVQVRVKGPYSLINSLESTAISAYVDVETLREGRHSLPIRVDRPQGVTEVTVDPAVAEVTIVIK